MNFREISDFLNKMYFENNINSKFQSLKKKNLSKMQLTHLTCQQKASGKFPGNKKL